MWSSGWKNISRIGPLICKCFTNNFPSSYSFFSVTYWFHKELLSFYFSPLLTVMNCVSCLRVLLGLLVLFLTFTVSCTFWWNWKIDFICQKKMRDKNRRSGSYNTRIQVALLYPCWHDAWNLDLTRAWAVGTWTRRHFLEIHHYKWAVPAIFIAQILIVNANRNRLTDAKFLVLASLSLLEINTTGLYKGLQICDFILCKLLSTVDTHAKSFFSCFLIKTKIILHCASWPFQLGTKVFGSLFSVEILVAYQSAQVIYGFLSSWLLLLICFCSG